MSVIGDISSSSQLSLLGYLAIAFSLGFILFKTRFGLRLPLCRWTPSSSGHVGKSMSINEIFRVIISGFLGGIGGAVMLNPSRCFSVITIVGPGFIALAAMIFGKWNPIELLSSLFFGLSQKFGCYRISIAVPTRSANSLSSKSHLMFWQFLFWPAFFEKQSRKSRWYQLYQIKISIQKNVSSFKLAFIFQDVG